eukprot:CAMPEP_0194450704 /NCGR_PEP_ID=MMETSP0176-20130528/130879_1 /TAXON_ID=216777 /ORGANISM="Proboscia alata, Strain PI-D3" /LENGTH=370 /DNA_ID=CAMNT_0039278035 /DNA_START=154 /DNA_END=1263 /DNA_ORIENTATION=-
MSKCTDSFKGKKRGNQVSFLRFIRAEFVTLLGVTVLLMMVSLASLQGRSLSVTPTVALRETSVDDSKKGIVVLDLLGLLGNNVFEVGFANAMATELGWDVHYRMVWNTKFMDPEAQTCFPHSFLRNQKTWQNGVIMKMLGDKNTTKHLEGDTKRFHAALETEGMLEDCIHMECDFTGAGMTDTLKRLSGFNSSIRVLHLRAFFIHGQWLHPLKTRKRMQEWFFMNPSCCQTPPPSPDTVVIHIRDFEAEDDDNKAAEHASRSMSADVYKHILRHYNYSNRPIWIVCQSKTIESRMVQSLQKRFPQVEIHTGVDEYDAFCILTKAPVLIAAYASTFSQAAALVADSQQVVHVPMVDETSNKPQVTIDIPDW